MWMSFFEKQSASQLVLSARRGVPVALTVFEHEVAHLTRDRGGSDPTVAVSHTFSLLWFSHKLKKKALVAARTNAEHPHHASL